MNQERQETMLEYVVRKLSSNAYNCAELSRQTNIAKSTLSEIGSGKNTDPRNSTVEKIYNYFKALAD